MYLNARAAAAEESSDVLIPVVRISTSGGKIPSSTGAALIHFEYAPIVEHTDKFHIHKKMNSTNANTTKYPDTVKSTMCKE